MKILFPFPPSHINEGISLNWAFQLSMIIIMSVTLIWSTASYSSLLILSSLSLLMSVHYALWMNSSFNNIQYYLWYSISMVLFFLNNQLIILVNHHFHSCRDLLHFIISIYSSISCKPISVFLLCDRAYMYILLVCNSYNIPGHWMSKA